MKEFSCVPAIPGAQDGDSLADVGVNGAHAQAQFQGDFLGSSEPIDVAEAFALPRCQALTELVGQLYSIANRQNRTACLQVKASPLRSPKQHPFFQTQA